MRDLNEIRNLSLKQIERIQSVRFAATVRWLLPHAPFYRKLFADYGVDCWSVNSVEDWHDLGLPLVKKSCYMSRPKEFVVSVSGDEALSVYKNYVSDVAPWSLSRWFPSSREVKDFFSLKMVAFSGGTESGRPTPVFLTSRQKQHNLSIVLKVGFDLLSEFLPREKIGMNVFPFAPHLGWHSVNQAFDIGLDLNLGTAGGAIPTERLAMIAGAMKPSVIAGMGGYLKNRFLPFLVDKHVRLPSKVLFFTGAEKLYDADRCRILELAKKLGSHASVIDLFGATELKEDILPECRPFSGFHHLGFFANILRVVRISRANKDFVTDWDFSDKDGYLVSWNIDGGGSLLEGFVLGDHVQEVRKDPCKYCSLPVERLFGVSRVRDVYGGLELTGFVEEKVKGARVNLTAVRDRVLSVRGVREVQVVLDNNDLELRVIADKTAKKELLKLDFEVKPRVKFVRSFSDSGLKFEGIVVR